MSVSGEDSKEITHTSRQAGMYALSADGCFLAALITGRVNSHAQPTAGERGATHTGGRTPMSIPEVLFSLSGRISRSEYWLKGTLNMLAFTVPYTLLV